jgi:predicted transcriptional regulator
MNKELTTQHKRTILEIIKGILNAAKDNAKGIPEGALLLCFASFGLSKSQYEDFSSMLIRSNLLQFNEDLSAFMITDKGINWLTRA